MIHSDLQYQQTKSWIEHCLDIFIYNKWSSSKHISHYKHYPIVDNVWELRDVIQSKHIRTTVITPYTHHVTFGVREAVVINSTLHHPSHGGKYRIYLKLRNSELRNSPPGTHPRGTLLVNSNIDGSSSRPRFVFPFYLSTVIKPKASDYLSYSVYLWSSTTPLTVFVVT